MAQYLFWVKTQVVHAMDPQPGSLTAHSGLRPPFTTEERSSVRLTEPAAACAGRRLSLPGRDSEPARAKEPIVRFPVQLCFVSKYNSEHSPFP